MATFEREFEPAFMELAKSLINLLPDSWTAADLHAVVQQAAEGKQVVLRISNPNLPQQNVEASPELAKALRALYRVCRNHDQAWTGCTLSVEADAEGNWSTDLRFDESEEGEEDSRRSGSASDAQFDPSRLSPKFQELFTRHAVLSYDKQCVLEAVLGKDCQWQFEMETGRLTLGSHEFPAQLLGTVSESSNTWLWAWANQQSGIPANLLTDANRLRDFGQRHGIPEFTEPKLGLDRIDPAHLAMVASGLCKSDLFYQGGYEGGAALMLATAPALKKKADHSVPHVIRVFLEFVQNVQIDHRRALLSYLEQKGYKAQAAENKIRATAPNGDPLEATLDDLGRVTNLSARASGADSPAPEEIVCTQCEKHYPWNDRFAGKTVTCKACGSKFQVGERP